MNKSLFFILLLTILFVLIFAEPTPQIFEDERIYHDKVAFRYGQNVSPTVTKESLHNPKATQKYRSNQSKSQRKSDRNNRKDEVPQQSKMSRKQNQNIPSPKIRIESNLKQPPSPSHLPFPTQPQKEPGPTSNQKINIEDIKEQMNKYLKDDFYKNVLPRYYNNSYSSNKQSDPPEINEPVRYYNSVKPFIKDMSSQRRNFEIYNSAAKIFRKQNKDPDVKIILNKYKNANLETDETNINNEVQIALSEKIKRLNKRNISSKEMDNALKLSDVVLRENYSEIQDEENHEPNEMSQGSENKLLLQYFRPQVLKNRKIENVQIIENNKDENNSNVKDLIRDILNRHGNHTQRTAYLNSKLVKISDRIHNLHLQKKHTNDSKNEDHLSGKLVLLDSDEKEKEPHATHIYQKKTRKSHSHVKTTVSFKIDMFDGDMSIAENPINPNVSFYSASANLRNLFNMARNFNQSKIGQKKVFNPNRAKNPQAVTEPGLSKNDMTLLKWVYRFLNEHGHNTTPKYLKPSTGYFDSFKQSFYDKKHKKNHGVTPWFRRVNDGNNQINEGTDDIKMMKSNSFEIGKKEDYDSKFEDDNLDAADVVDIDIDETTDDFKHVANTFKKSRKMHQEVSRPSPNKGIPLSFIFGKSQKDENSILADLEKTTMKKFHLLEFAQKARYREKGVITTPKPVDAEEYQRKLREKIWGADYYTLNNIATYYSKIFKVPKEQKLVTFLPSIFASPKMSTQYPSSYVQTTQTYSLPRGSIPNSSNSKTQQQSSPQTMGLLHQFKKHHEVLKIPTKHWIAPGKLKKMMNNPLMPPMREKVYEKLKKENHNSQQSTSHLESFTSFEPSHVRDFRNIITRRYRDVGHLFQVPFSIRNKNDSDSDSTKKNETNDNNDISASKIMNATTNSLPSTREYKLELNQNNIRNTNVPTKNSSTTVQNKNKINLSSREMHTQLKSKLNMEKKNEIIFGIKSIFENSSYPPPKSKANKTNLKPNVLLRDFRKVQPQIKNKNSTTENLKADPLNLGGQVQNKTKILSSAERKRKRINKKVRKLQKHNTTTTINNQTLKEEIKIIISIRSKDVINKNSSLPHQKDIKTNQNIRKKPGNNILKIAPRKESTNELKNSKTHLLSTKIAKKKGNFTKVDKEFTDQDFKDLFSINIKEKIKKDTGTNRTNVTTPDNNLTKQVVKTSTSSNLFAPSGTAKILPAEQEGKRKSKGGQTAEDATKEGMKPDVKSSSVNSVFLNSTEKLLSAKNEDRQKSKGIQTTEDTKNGNSKPENTKPNSTFAVNSVVSNDTEKRPPAQKESTVKTKGIQTTENVTKELNLTKQKAQSFTSSNLLVPKNTAILKSSEKVDNEKSKGVQTADEVTKEDSEAELQSTLAAYLVVLKETEKRPIAEKKDTIKSTGVQTAELATKEDMNPEVNSSLSIKTTGENVTGAENNLSKQEPKYTTSANLLVLNDTAKLPPVGKENTQKYKGNSVASNDTANHSPAENVNNQKLKGVKTTANVTREEINKKINLTKQAVISPTTTNSLISNNTAKRPPSEKEKKQKSQGIQTEDEVTTSSTRSTIEKIVINQTKTNVTTLEEGKIQKHEGVQTENRNVEKRKNNEASSKNKKSSTNNEKNSFTSSINTLFEPIINLPHKEHSSTTGNATTFLLKRATKTEENDPKENLTNLALKEEEKINTLKEIQTKSESLVKQNVSAFSSKNSTNHSKTSINSIIIKTILPRKEEEANQEHKEILTENYVSTKAKILSSSFFELNKTATSVTRKEEETNKIRKEIQIEKDSSTKRYSLPQDKIDVYMNIETGNNLPRNKGHKFDPLQEIKTNVDYLLAKDNTATTSIGSTVNDLVKNKTNMSLSLTEDEKKEMLDIIQTKIEQTLLKIKTYLSTYSSKVNITTVHPPIVENSKQKQNEEKISSRKHILSTTEPNVEKSSIMEEEEKIRTTNLTNSKIKTKDSYKKRRDLDEVDPDDSNPLTFEESSPTEISDRKSEKGKKQTTKSFSSKTRNRKKDTNQDKTNNDYDSLSMNLDEDSDFPLGEKSLSTTVRNWNKYILKAILEEKLRLLTQKPVMRRQQRFDTPREEQQEKLEFEESINKFINYPVTRKPYELDKRVQNEIFKRLNRPLNLKRKKMSSRPDNYNYLNKDPKDDK